MYERLVKFLHLKFIDADESWPYQVFKKKIRNMLRSTDRWLDNDHFSFGEWRRRGCFARGCKLCESDPPDSDGDGSHEEQYFFLHKVVF